MFGADKGSVSTDDRLNGKKLKIGIVQARFNADRKSTRLNSSHVD